MHMRYTLIIKSENVPGTLYRIAGLLLRKKINIENLYVKRVDQKRHTSHFIIEIFLSPHLMAKLIKQIDRAVEVTHAEYHRTSSQKRFVRSV